MQLRESSYFIISAIFLSAANTVFLSILKFHLLLDLDFPESVHFLFRRNTTCEGKHAERTAFFCTHYIKI